MLCFLKGPSVALVAGYRAEILDWAKQKLVKMARGLTRGDIIANKKGVEYGNELIMRYGIYQ